ncbi:hypothetical protein [Burkholderia cepacia]|uniref:hypothetical protein n=1 Tax=Burkholderia cepacia TaxID=292 RepID=UPI0026E00C57|nr:hypothetical protein [Burkholderia cepacia]MDO5947993.1 hypothetical protein [Burkholderia cepacia]
MSHVPVESAIAATPELPDYSPTLVSLARSYDRARMATAATEWLLADLRGTDEDPSSSVIGEFAEERVSLLRAQLDPMGEALEDLVIAQSLPWLEISRDSSGVLDFPESVREMMDCIEMPAFFYKEGDEADALAKGSAYRDSHYLILWVGDCHLLPKSYPKAFFEVWWSLWWRNAVALEEKPGYGWLVHHNEL